MRSGPSCARTERERGVWPRRPPPHRSPYLYTRLDHLLSRRAHCAGPTPTDREPTADCRPAAWSVVTSGIADEDAKGLCLPRPTFSHPTPAVMRPSRKIHPLLASSELLPGPPSCFIRTRAWRSLLSVLQAWPTQAQGSGAGGRSPGARAAISRPRFPAEPDTAPTQQATATSFGCCRACTRGPGSLLCSSHHGSGERGGPW